MDDIQAYLPLDLPPGLREEFLELSIGIDPSDTDLLDQLGDILLKADHVHEYTIDSLLRGESSNSLLEIEEDIYANLLIEDELSTGQSVVLNSTVDESLMPGNISPVLLEESQDDPLLLTVSSLDELLESESEQEDILVDEVNEVTVLREVEMQLNSTSEDIISIALDQGLGLPESDELPLEQNWSIANVTHDNQALDGSHWDAFSIDIAVPDLQSFGDEKLYLQTRLVGDSDDAVIDINIFDNRKTDTALTGLNLDLAWDAERLSLNESRFEPQDVFYESGAPLFQSLGTTNSLTNELGEEIQMISGLTAAALPMAGTGKPMGKESISGAPEITTFASIPVRQTDLDQKNGFTLKVNEAVQADGIILHPDELIILVDEQEMHVLNVDKSILRKGDYVVDVVNTSNQLSRIRLSHSVENDLDFDGNKTAIANVTHHGNPVSSEVVTVQPPSPLLIESSDAHFLSPGVWKQSVSLKQDQTPWSLSLDGLFSDRDRAQQLDVIQSGQLPSWLQFSATDSFTAGELTARPNNADVGNSAAQLSFIDSDGQLATLLLDFAVENVNDAPLLRRSDQPLTLTIDSDEINQTHRVARRLDLADLFHDPDQLYGDDLEFSIIGVTDHAGVQMADLDWLRISHAATELADVESNVDLRPELSVIDEHGESRSISIEDVSDLDAGSLIGVDIVLSDQRSVEDLGLIAVDFDIQLSESLVLQKDSVTLSSSLPIFQNIDLNDDSNSVDFSTLSIQAGALPRFGLGQSVGEQSHVLTRFTLEVSDPTQIHSIGISPGQGPSRDGLLDLSGESVDSDLISAHSISSRSASYLEVLSAQSLAEGQYLVAIQATDASGESVSYQLPIFVGSQQQNGASNHPLSSALLRQMSSKALTDLWQLQTSQSDSISFSESIALGGLSHLSSLESSSIQSAVEDGRFHISPSLESSLPLLALYSEGSSQIDAETVLQREATSLLEDAELVSSTIQAPLGALEFSLTGSQKSSIEVVNIAMAEGGVELNRLYKSTREGELLSFASEVIVPPEGLTASERDQWLHTLSYSIYDYSLDEYVPVSSYSAESGFALNQKDLNEDVDLNGLDGSAYLIDFDNDGLTDMISLALVDQGYFDLDQRSGVIKDPVVPIYDADYAHPESSLDPSLEQLVASAPVSVSLLSTPSKPLSPLAPKVTILPEVLSQPLSPLAPEITGLSVVLSQPISPLSPLETEAPDIRHQHQELSISSKDHFASSEFEDQIAGIDPIRVSPKTLNFNSTQKELQVGHAEFDSFAKIDLVAHSISSAQHQISVSSLSSDFDDDTLPASNKVPALRHAKSSNFLANTIHRMFPFADFLPSDPPLSGVVDDLSIHLSDLGGSLLVTLGLTSIPHLSQLSMPALHRIKRRQPLSITRRLNESRLQRFLSVPGVSTSLSLSIKSGRLSIKTLMSPTSSQDRCYGSLGLSDLYRISSQPGLFAHECLAALQKLSSVNSEPMDWVAWLNRLSTSIRSDISIGLLNKTLSSAFSQLNLLLASSPSAADLYMAVEISGLLISKGFACSDLPGYRSQSCRNG